MTDRWDAVVVGGGPAGLSAALWLARYRRRTLVLDDDHPRNEAAWAVHGFPGLPDPAPEELRRRLRDQAVAAGARLGAGCVTRLSGRKDAFELRTADDDAIAARRVVLAYGRTDRLPDLPGLRDFYGSAVFHCPDCDGPAVTGRAVGVLGHDRQAATLALYLLTWTADVTLLTNGLAPDLPDRAATLLADQGIAIRREPVRRVDGRDGRLREVVLEDGPLPLDALFFHWGSDPASDLAVAAGCERDDSGDLRVEPSSLETSVPGVYAAGDLAGRPYLAIAAAAEGVRAALALHRSLLPPAFEL